MVPKWAHTNGCNSREAVVTGPGPSQFQHEWRSGQITVSAPFWYPDLAVSVNLWRTQCQLMVILWLWGQRANMDLPVVSLDKVLDFFSHLKLVRLLSCYLKVWLARCFLMFRLKLGMECTYWILLMSLFYCQQLDYNFLLDFGAVFPYLTF